MPSIQPQIKSIFNYPMARYCLWSWHKTYQCSFKTTTSIEPQYYILCMDYIIVSGELHLDYKYGHTYWSKIGSSTFLRKSDLRASISSPSKSLKCTFTTSCQMKAYAMPIFELSNKRFDTLIICNFPV